MPNLQLQYGITTKCKCECAQQQQRAQRFAFKRLELFDFHEIRCSTNCSDDKIALEAFEKIL